MSQLKKKIFRRNMSILIYERKTSFTVILKTYFHSPRSQKACQNSSISVDYNPLAFSTIKTDTFDIGYEFILK